MTANIEEGQKQVERIPGKQFDDKTEITIDNFTITRREKASTTDTGNPQKSKHYTFSLIAGVRESQRTTPAHLTPTVSHQSHPSQPG